MSVPRYWRERKFRYRLIGEKCVDCGIIFFPRKATCPKCGCREISEHKLLDRGTVVSWTIIRNPPEGYEKYVPYVVALIELDDGVKVLSQLVDIEPEDVKTGMRVESAFRRVKEDGNSGIIEYGYKFRPIL